MEALIFHRNITKTLCTSDEWDKFKVISLCSSSICSGSKLLNCIVLVLIVVPSSLSRSSSSSKLFVSLFLVIVLVPSLVRKILPNPMGFVISSHLSYAWSKQAFNFCIRRVRVEKPQCGSMKALIFHRNITKFLCPSDECDQFKVICLCSSSSSSKVFVCLFLVLVLVQSIVSKKTAQPNGNCYFLSYVT